MRRRVGWLAGSVVLASMAYLATGLCLVAPGEVVVARRLGRFAEPRGPGLHWGWPWGLERRDRLRTDEVRRIEIGLDRVPGADDDPGAGEFLTGDRNLVRLRAVVQYRVADPVRHVAAAAEFERLLARLAESSLARSLASRGIDGALRGERGRMAEEARAELARLSDRCELGLSILAVSVTDARPPAEVQAAFDEAQEARSERARRRNEAASYADAARPSALAAARSATDRAEADARRAVTAAQARSGRFLALLAESHRDRALTARRLYLDALRDLLPRLGRKLVLAPGEPIDLSLFGVRD